MNAIPQNPFTTGPGQTPPYLAGRNDEQVIFRNLLRQRPIMKNAILTGLRGIGKTALLATLRGAAVAEGWIWVGTDWSESASVSEETLAIRILADLAFQTSTMVVKVEKQQSFGFATGEKIIQQPVNYEILKKKFDQTPGLTTDKLKAVIEYVWSAFPSGAVPGIVFAYDEAQTLDDHAEKEQYPLSVLIETFQSLQRKELPVLLVLTGLPTLLTKLTEARTYTERMFDVMTLKGLEDQESRDAIVKPTENSSLKFSAPVVEKIVEMSGGYPYFIQYICREVMDVWIPKLGSGEITEIPAPEIVQKLDNNFFQSRWRLATDRQREMLQLIAGLPDANRVNREFTVAEIVAASKTALGKPFKPSNANIMLVALCERELVYKNRFGRYVLAIPLLAQFIQRQAIEGATGR